MEKSAQTHPQKIAFLLPSLSAGGAERVMITLMNGLDITLFKPSLYSAMANEELRGLVAPHVALHILGKKNIWAAMPALWQALRRERPDTIVSTMAHMNFIILLLKPFLPKTRIIVREAIVPSFFFQNRAFTAPLIKAAYKILYPHADLVLSPSEQIIEEFKNTLNMEQLEYACIRNPASSGMQYHAETDFLPWKKTQDTIHFIASGRLHPQKGFDRLIEQLPLFKPEFQWHLHIIGQGAQKDDLLNLIAKNNLASNVTLEGHKEKPWEYYRHADAFLLPSRWEGLPNVALESLACGVPVIASAEAGGIAEIANLSEKGAVQIASGMEDFLKLMAQTRPTNSHNKKSLLPAPFHHAEVIRKFQEILTS